MRASALTFVATALVVLVLFGRAALPGHMPADFTLVMDTYHLSLICERYAEHVTGPGDPFWMHEFGGGYPVHALWMYGCFSTSLLPWLALPIETAYSWGTVLHLAFGALGMHLLLRDEGGSPTAAATAGLLFAVCEFTVAKAATGHVNQLWSLVWVPWLLRSVRCTVAGKPRSPAILGAVAALALLAGHVQTWFFAGPFVVAYAGALLWRSGDRGPAVRRLFVGAALCVGLTAVQWMPALDFMSVADRPEPDAGLFRQWSAPLHVLASKIAPGMFGARPADAFGAPYWGGEPFEHEHAGIGGVVVLLLALAGARRAPHRRLLVVTACAGLVLAVGARAPVLGELHRLPVVGWGRVPARAQLLTVIAGAWLAGHGVERLLAADRRALVRSVAVALGATAMLAGVVWWGTHELDAQRFATTGLRALLTSVLGGGLLVAAISFVRRRGSWAALVPAAAVVGVWLAGLPPIHAVETDFLHTRWSQRLPQQASGHRVHLADFRLPYVETDGVATFRRPAHVDTRGMRRLHGAMGPALARWMDVGATLVRPVRDRGPPTGIDDATNVLTHGSPFGPGRAFGAAVVVADDAQAVTRLAGGETVLLLAESAEVEAPATLPPRGVPVPALPARAGERTALDVSGVAATGGAWVFVPEKWYPGVSAQVDGRPAALVRANVAFVAAAVPRGANRLAIVRTASPVRRGALVALLALVLGCAVAASSRLRSVLGLEPAQARVGG